MIIRKFYAVTAQNGVAIFSTWESADKSRRYLKGFNCKKFYTFIDAENYLQDQLHESGIVLPVSLILNKIEFFSHYNI